MLKEPFKFFKLSIGNVYVPINIETPRGIKALNYNGTLVVKTLLKAHQKLVIFKYLFTQTICNHLRMSQFYIQLFQLKQLLFLKVVLQSQFTGTDNHYLISYRAICQFRGDKMGLINSQLTLPTHVLQDHLFKTFQAQANMHSQSTKNMLFPTHLETILL